MLKDLSLGTILYVLVSILFGYTFDANYYILSLVFSVLPDADFILYVLFKKQLALVTHRIIHYPIIFASIGLFICTTNLYMGLLFLAIVLDHFALDSFSATEYPTGIRWLYPFSKKSWYIFKGRIYQLTAMQQNEQLSKRRATWNAKEEKRTVLWEVLVRIDRIDLISIMLVGLAATAITIFLLGS